MDSSTSRPQFSSIMPNDLLARVERMRLQPNRRRSNRSRGEHLSGKGGTSIEFTDYRDYVAGDDIRHVDWNIFVRLQRPYLKLYSHEEEMHIVILLDASTSMRGEEKFERARQLAAAFSVMGLMAGERVSVFAGTQAGMLPAVRGTSGRISVQKVLRFLENIEPGGDSFIDESVDTMLQMHTGRGIAVVISDFLTFGDTARAFNLLYSAGLELFGIQLLGPSELNPDVTGDLRFVDSETGVTLDISSARELLGLYHEHLAMLRTNLEDQARGRNGRFVSLSSDTPLQSILFDTLLRKGWIR